MMAAMVVLGILAAIALLVWDAMYQPAIDVPDYYYWLP